jgi:cysteinyl-tRNA synthetase
MIKIFDTYTKKKRRFVPIEKNKVGIYCCGPTVYNYAHIGNLRTYIFEDILRRVLEYNGFEVKHVMNVTDVGHLTSDADTGEDKIELGARREGKSAWEIADFYTKAFFKDIERLNILKPTIVCKATDHINDMIELIKKLEEKGYTYKISDGIYYDTSKFKEYGKLSGMKFEELNEKLKAGARVEFNPEKKNITDFALWKFSPKDKKRQMEWNSPWGIGFPGWHIECSTMSMKYLGEHFDIHCGGIDHIPIHHTNEIAQSEAATGKKFVNYWVHGAFLVLGKNIKMAKSGENFITLQSLIEKGYDPLAYRYLCLTTHYRSELEFSWDNLDSAANSLSRVRENLRLIKEDMNYKVRKRYVNKYKKKFIDAVNDDLNTPVALSVLWEVIRNKELNNNEKYELIKEFDKILGLNLDIEEKIELTDEQKKLIEQREEARKRKDWKTADEIRNKLKEQGIILEDTEKGVKIRKI